MDKEAMESSEDRLKAIVKKWRIEYDKTIPEKLKILENLVSRLRVSIDEDTLKSLRLEIHKMAGSAGTVGYMPVSDICKKFDQELFSKIQSYKESPPDATWVPSFESYLKLIREGFSSNFS